MNLRPLQTLLTAQPASDGAGVKLHRIVGPNGMRGLDPFLLLDEFASDSAADYIAGFPPHPHRGFETVTYMLAGEMLHEDHLGNRGRLSAGGVQWMTAGRGVIHSEMPQQAEGRMRGFQLWINLPAAEKLKDPAYREIPAATIPVATLPNGGTVKAIAGRCETPGGTLVGAVSGISTEPLYLDVRLPPGTDLAVPVSRGHRALVYLYGGSLGWGDRTQGVRQMAVLGDGDGLELRAGPEGAQALVLAARPLNEPMAHYGPFVMNTREEIDQAIRDYDEGRLAA
jgi:redox-sensitive bicupin YhaK (pirin superfamily)